MPPDLLQLPPETTEKNEPMGENIKLATDEIEVYDARFDRTLRLKILHHDANYIIVDKPWDLRVDGDTAVSPTVELALLRAFPAYTKLFPCHQIDYATSGIYCVGLTREAASAACKLFQERQVTKVYLALVRGHVSHSQSIQRGIRRNPNGKGMAIGFDGDPGRASRTDISVIQRGWYLSVPCSLLSVQLFTGRMHQIRVHVAQGLDEPHPILGDTLYEEPEATGCFRMMLHALELSLKFEQPVSGIDYGPAGLTIRSQDPFACLFEADDWCRQDDAQKPRPPNSALPKCPAAKLGGGGGGHAPGPGDTPRA